MWQGRLGDGIVKGQARAYDPAIHHRRSIRLRGHDYAGKGAYFVTIRLARHRPLFGTVVRGRMVLNAAGRKAAACWQAIPAHFPRATLDEWIIMPDHVHGIIAIRPDHSSLAARAETVPSHQPHPPSPSPHGTSRTLGSIVRGFKIGVTQALGGDSPWQRGYHDIIVRDERALHAFRRYIRENPMRWDALRHGEPRFFAGNRNLLQLP